MELTGIQPAALPALTAGQKESAAWRHFGQRVLLGAGLLDATAGQDGVHHTAAWREMIVANRERLRMYSHDDCIIGILEGNYTRGCKALGIQHAMEDYAQYPEPYDFGFLTCSGMHDGDSCDPVAAAYVAETGGQPSTMEALRDAWLTYIEASYS